MVVAVRCPGGMREATDKKKSKRGVEECKLWSWWEKRKNEREIQMDLGTQSHGGRSFNGLHAFSFEIRSALSIDHNVPHSRPLATSSLEIYSVSISFHTYFLI